MQVQEGGILISYYKVTPGKEKEIFKVDDTGLIFKALGEFDLVTFDALQSLNGNTPAGKQHMSATHSKKSFGLITELYKTPSIIEWISGAKLLGDVSLAIDRTLLNPSNLDLFYVQLVRSLVEKYGPDKLVVMGALGHHDLQLIYKADSFQDLFCFAQGLRSMQIGDIVPGTTFGKLKKELKVAVLADTKCTPLVSYKNVIHCEQFAALKGNVMAQIAIHCPPGAESFVVKSLRNTGLLDDKSGKEAERKFIIGATLGTYDLNLTTLRAIDAGELIKNLLRFRAEWCEHDYLQFSTMTMLSNIDEVIDDTKITQFLKWPEFEQYDDVDPRFTLLQPLIAARISSLIQKYTSVLSLRSFAIVAEDIGRMPERIAGEVLNYIDQCDLHAQLNPHLPQIVDLITSAEVALSQRTEGDIYPSDVTKGETDSYGGGELSSLIAVRYLINFLIETASSSIDSSEMGWTGCVYYSDPIGYALKTGSVFCVPHGALHEPFAPTSAWGILTHEISHYIFTANEEYNSTTDGITSQIVRSMVELHGSMDSPRETLRAEKLYFELWGTWFDYYHFHNKELDEFQKSVWSGWFGIPIFMEDPNEYVARAFIIYLLDDNDMILVPYSYGRSIKSLVADAWVKYTEYVHDLVNKIEIDEILSEVAGDVCIEAEIFVPIIGPMFLKHVNDDLRRQVSSEYEDLQKHVEMIKNSEIVTDHIPNPYMLYRKIQDWYNSAPKTIFGASIALIKSFEHQRIVMAEIHGGD
jgi:hypothetical protein